MTDMREVIREQTQLAQTFAEDGAYHSAARVLADLADKVKAHVIAFDRQFAAQRGRRRK
jgi:hypothetical protein